MQPEQIAEKQAVTSEGLPSGQQLVPQAETPPEPTKEIAVRRFLRWRPILAGVVAVAVAIGAAYWWTHRIPPLPTAIVLGNGRIEADPIDIATKFAGRILELRVDEGARVGGGQVVAVMDTRDLNASLKKSEALAEQAKKEINEANALLNQQHSQVVLAQQEMERAASLLKSGWVTKELFDQRQESLNSAKAGELAAEARVTEAEHALDAANHDSELYRVNIADNTLVAPRDGRIAYRIANTGEVLPAGGRVFTMLDFGYVYMDVYLPTPRRGQSEDRKRCAHRARRLSGSSHSGDRDLHRRSGAVHA